MRWKTGDCSAGRSRPGSTGDSVPKMSGTIEKGRDILRIYAHARAHAHAPDHGALRLTAGIAAEGKGCPT